MSRTRIADDPAQWIIPDDIKDKPPILPADPTSTCPQCGTMWMYHSSACCNEAPSAFIFIGDVND